MAIKSTGECLQIRLVLIEIKTYFNQYAIAMKFFEEIVFVVVLYLNSIFLLNFVLRVCLFTHVPVKLDLLLGDIFGYSGGKWCDKRIWIGQQIQPS